MEPFKKLVRCANAEHPSENSWMKFYQVGDVKVGVELGINGYYAFVITREPDLGLKVLANRTLRSLEFVVSVGDLDSAVRTAIRAINQLEG